MRVKVYIKIIKIIILFIINDFFIFLSNSLYYKLFLYKYNTIANILYYSFH